MSYSGRTEDLCMHWRVEHRQHEIWYFGVFKPFDV